jgi:hypothetical protein
MCVQTTKKFAYLEKKQYLCTRNWYVHFLHDPRKQQMSMLFNTSRNNITLHIGNIFKEHELERDSVCKESLLTALKMDWNPDVVLKEVR